MTKRDLPRALEHLTELVACDTQNPPRRIRGGDAIFRYLGTRLEMAGFSVALLDHGDGCVTLGARRGAPRLLWNFHLDTVPAVGEWTAHPLALRIESERAVGRGAVDVKGAVACMLAAVESTFDPVALLFTSDEEAGEDRCVRAFLESAKAGDWEGVIVGEPTGCLAVLAHRGMATATGVFDGVAGHASSPGALEGSALHESVRWAARALAYAEAEEERAVHGLHGIRFNLGVLHGGTKPNIIADRAELRFGVRSRPGEDPAALARALTALAPNPGRATWKLGFVGPPLPPPSAPVGDATKLAARLGLAVSPPVDFWSEASLFAEAGFPSLVFGPGHIAQAHAVDEWVTLEQLDEALGHYRRMLAAP